MTTSSDTLAEDDILLQLVHLWLYFGLCIKWAAIAARVSRMLAELLGQDVPEGRLSRSLLRGTMNVLRRAIVVEKLSGKARN